MVGLIATTLLAGARMPAGATRNMKRKIPRDAADRIAVAGPERDVRHLVPLLMMYKCHNATATYIQHEAKNSEGRSRSYCSRWAGAGCQKFGSFPADGEVFFLDIPFYRTLRVEETCYQGRFGTPKTKASRRELPLPSVVVRALLAHRLRSSDKSDEALVFCTSNGTPLASNNLRKRQLHPACVRAGLAPINWHSLRHTHGTLLHEQGT